jgi:hypothetical protein
VLADRQLEPAERRQRHAADDHRDAALAAHDEAGHEQDDPDEDGQLDQREIAPRRGRAILERRAARPRLARGLALGLAPGELSRAPLPRGIALGARGRALGHVAALTAALTHSRRGRPNRLDLLPRGLCAWARGAQGGLVDLVAEVGAPAPPG